VLFGLTRNTTSADLARAALEGVALMVTDLIETADQESGRPLAELRVDGGMARNARFLQVQADLLGRPVRRAANEEATALGAAFLAGLRAGMWGADELRRLSPAAARFDPQMPPAERDRSLRRWRRAIRAVIAFYQEND
jgi:glycerol kinase